MSDNGIDATIALIQAINGGIVADPHSQTPAQTVTAPARMTEYPAAIDTAKVPLALTYSTGGSTERLAFDALNPSRIRAGNYEILVLVAARGQDRSFWANQAKVHTLLERFITRWTQIRQLAMDGSEYPQLDGAIQDAGTAGLWQDAWHYFKLRLTVQEVW